MKRKPQWSIRALIIYIFFPLAAFLMLTSIRACISAEEYDDTSLFLKGFLVLLCIVACIGIYLFLIALSFVKRTYSKALIAVFSLSAFVTLLVMAYNFTDPIQETYVQAWLLVNEAKLLYAIEQLYKQFGKDDPVVLFYWGGQEGVVVYIAYVKDDSEATLKIIQSRNSVILPGMQRDLKFLGEISSYANGYQLNMPSRERPPKCELDVSKEGKRNHAPCAGVMVWPSSENNIFVTRLKPNFYLLTLRY